MRPWSRSGLLGTVFAVGFLVWRGVVGVGFAFQERLVFAGATFGLGVDVPDARHHLPPIATDAEAHAAFAALWDAVSAPR